MMLLAVNQWAYVFVSWGIAVFMLGAYGVRLVRTGKKLSKSVLPEDQRWNS